MNNNQYNLDLANVPKELKLIFEILNDNDQQNVEYLKDMDWELFITLAKHHRIYPLLNKKLKLLDQDFIPSHVLQTLSYEYRRNTFQMLHLSAEMESVSRLFAEEKISVLFLKGPVLAHDLYGDISLRTSSDLDVLIPLQELEKAESLLVALGYVKDDYIETILGDWTWRHHHVSYVHPQKRVKVEVHWRLNPGPSIEPRFQELWNRRRESKLTSSSVYLLGKEDLFLFLVSHGARHGWSRLRWLVDIQHVLKQNLDWQSVYKLFKKYHYLHVGGQALVLGSAILGCELSKGALSLISGKRPVRLAEEVVFYMERMVNLHTDPVPEEVSNYHGRHLFALMSTQQKLLYILSFLYPYPEDAETLPLPKPYHFLYFPLRPFLWAWRKTRKHALP